MDSRIWRSLRIYVSLRWKFIMMESVPRSVWKRGRATLPPGASPGSAMILQQASGNEDLSVWMDAAINAASSVRKGMIT